MRTHAKGPARLWLFVPPTAVEHVMALNSEFRDVRVSTADDEPLAPTAHSLGLAVLLIGEKYGTYGGVIGGRPILTRNSGLDESEIRAKIKRKNPKWSENKLDRAVRDILASKHYNAHSDHETRDYERLWHFLGKVVSLCGEAIIVYDNGRTVVLEEVTPTALMFRERIASAHRIKVKENDATALYSIEPHEFYIFE